MTSSSSLATPPISAKLFSESPQVVILSPSEGSPLLAPVVEVVVVGNKPPGTEKKKEWWGRGRGRGEG